MNKKNDIITDSVPNIVNCTVPLRTEDIVAIQALTGKRNKKDAVTQIVREYLAAGKR